MSLYTLTGDLVALLNMLQQDEYTEEDLKDTIEMVSEEWGERAEAVLAVIKNLTAEAEDIRVEEQALAKRRKKKEKAVERLTEYLSASMQALDMPRYESARHCVSFRTSHRIRITDEAALLEWARENAPEIIKRGEDSISKDEVKALARTTNVPYMATDTIKNIQIG